MIRTGVTRVIPLPFGVAVIGDTVEATRLGRFALKVKWDNSASKAAPFDSAKAFDAYVGDLALMLRSWHFR